MPLGKSRIITEQTLGLVIDRPVVNIDSPLDLEWARFLLRRRQTSGRDEQVQQ